MLITPNPCTPEGKAIVNLADQMDALQRRAGEWPGADTATIVEQWLRSFSFEPSGDLPQRVTGRVWMLRQWDRHGEDVTLWSDEASARAALAHEVRKSWDNVGGVEEVPFRPPTDDREAVDLYYGPDGCAHEDEGYSLHVADISRIDGERLSISLADPEGSARANSAALFHPIEGPDDEGLPCIEIAGVLVFAYLDAERQAVRIDVHLDTADEQLVRADGTIPIRIEVEDDTVCSIGATAPAPAHACGACEPDLADVPEQSVTTEGLSTGVDHTQEHTII
ncbi:hypothetical protein [Streptomyces sp. N35]|uniref:hypothetical protein n=1 Tax=Streptomyces sp. N35 TaxID=2795730 RepID=UPI0018F44026|nr:hypothetical protein [Streptomyces sp. N35]